MVIVVHFTNQILGLGRNFNYSIFQICVCVFISASIHAHIRALWIIKQTTPSSALCTTKCYQITSIVHSRSFVRIVLVMIAPKRFRSDCFFRLLSGIFTSECGYELKSLVNTLLFLFHNCVCCSNLIVIDWSSSCSSGEKWKKIQC